jgi:acetylornithine/succinyldiaminopimelate/putrescine aminotransferase
MNTTIQCLRFFKSYFNKGFHTVVLGRDLAALSLSNQEKFYDTLYPLLSTVEPDVEKGILYLF